MSSNVGQFLSLLRRLDVRVWGNEGQLRYEAPPGVVTADLRARLAEHKEEILAFLRSRPSHAEPAPAIRRRATQEPPVLSHAQQRMWFLDQLETGGAYNVAGAVRLAGPLDVAALRRSVDEIVSRHESLRTSVPARDGRPAPVIAPALRVPLEVVDLGGLEAHRREAEARRLATEETLRPFDLAKGPLLRTKLLRLAPTEHALLIGMHHIVSDGWSLGLFTRELAVLYRAFAAGEPSPLPPLPLQYSDYAAWQRDWLQGDVLERQLAYWRRQLEGAALLELPTDGPRPSAPSGRAGRAFRQLPAEVADAVAALAQRESATPFMVLLAAFQALLHRYTGQDDIVLGAPIANRTRAETESLIGLFVNALVMRTEVSGEPTFRELLLRVRTVALGAFDHQDVPFERLVDELGVERDLGRNPLFQVVFALQNAPIEPLRLEGLDLRPMETDAATTRFDLELHVREHAGGLTAAIAYSADLFDGTSVERILAHYHRLLEDAVARPDRRISQLALLGPEEARLVTEVFASGAAERAGEPLVHDRVADEAQRRPHATAVGSGEERLSYAELERRAGALAGRLRARGVGPEVLVGLCAPRSSALVVGALGVLKAGGAYVPLDPVNPRERLRAMIQAARLALVLTTADQAAQLEGLDVTLLRVDAPATSDDVTGAPAAALSPDNLAYAIFTSGSTGAPKAVGLTHRGLSNLARWHRRAYGVGEDDRATLLAGVGFDASVWEIWPYLTAGASLHVAPEDDRAEPRRLLSWMAAEGITLSFLPTPLAEAVLAEERPHGLALRALLTGGDRLHRPPAAGLPFRLFNNYGPTEDTVVATWTEVPPADGEAPPIGRPVDENRLYVLDAHLRPVPVGVPGELYIGGAGLARGYLGRPDLTAASFVPDPIGGTPGARLYRTGDRSRWRADGQLEFLGRIDQQVKLRGFRIELEEIEAVLLRHPSVGGAAVVASQDAAGDSRLVAYVAAAAGATASAAELREHLRDRLPEYMVPSAFLVLEALPLTPNGKVDRRALPAPDPLDHDPSVAPRSPVEEAVAAVWSEVLGVAHVGARDDFFESGGHSLLATQVVSRLRATLGVELPLRTLFESPTVEGLARAIESARRGEQAVVPPMRRAPRDAELPLSYAQQRLWFLDQMEAGAAYNVPCAVRMLGALDREALETSLRAVVARHESLRTRFPAVDGRPSQVIERSVELPLTRTDLSGLPKDEREATAARLARTEAEQPFDLSRGPLVRAMLLGLGEHHHVLLLTFHHIVFDGWSLGVFFGELSAQYRARREGHEPALGDLSIQYADFARWQREWLQGETRERQLGYWRQRLRDVPRLELPTDRPRPLAQTYAAGAHRFELPPRTAERLKALCRRGGATPFMVLLAAFKALLARYTGQRDIALGSPIASRTWADTEGLIGFFVNSLVLRTDLSGDPTFDELVARVKDVALGAYDHQHLPFEMLVEELHPERDLARNPLFQVIFAVQNAPREALELPGLELRAFDSGPPPTRFDMEVHVWESASRIAAAIYYNADLFDEATVARLFRHYGRLLDAAVAEPARRVSELPLMDADEERAVVALGAGRRSEYPRDGTVGEVFAAQVARAPEAEALVCGAERLSYGELDRRSNRLAHHLRGLGVGPDVRVGICVERGLDMVVGVLGIVKAGGAYVPLEASYPRERLSFMLRDAGVPVLLTQERLRRGLPEHGAAVVCLDADRAAIDARPDAPLASGVTPEHLAYVTYTSGSTGLPKGVEVRHRGVLRLVLGADYARLSKDETLLQLAPISFDASTLEIWGALLLGARCVVVEERVPAIRELGDVLRAEQVSTLWLTASLYNAVIDEAPEVLRPVRQLLIGGEALSVSHVRRGLAALPDTQVINGYGPTESTTFTCCHPIPRPLPEAMTSIPIGRPIANTDVSVLDERMRPVPVGVAGELYIGGDGLARGYLNRPALTAERFVPDPIGGSGQRLYRTGDRVRWLADGTLEFLGRTDDQVKVRGFRIELGEIESVLGRHPSVGRAAVLAREAARDKQIVAYVVPGGEGGAGDTSGRDGRVEQWQRVYDSVIYDRLEDAGSSEPTFNISGWNSTYTGQPIPADEMREQVDQAVERILAGRPRRVLEIGCGTGLLLFRVAPRCEAYVGTDFSDVALDYVRGELDRRGGERPPVELWRRRAEDWSGIAPGSFDTVVLNSVIQYFPDVEYLLSVLDGAVAAVGPGGRIFLGDVRHLPLLEAFAASVQLHQAPPSTSGEQLRERVKEHLAQEQELVVDPSLFAALRSRHPRISHVEVLPKRGRAVNELTKYRYDAVLHVEAASAAVPVESWSDWDAEHFSLRQIRERLSTGPSLLALRAVPNARVASDVAHLRWLHGDTDGPRGGAGGVDPEDLWALGEEMPYDVHVSWASGRRDGRFDVVFRRRDAEPLRRGETAIATAAAEPRPWRDYANDPLQGTQVRSLIPQLRRFLQQRLPEYMVPSSFVLLESMPLSPNGKVDQRALAAIEPLRADEDERAFEEPRSEAERVLSRVWSQVLGLSRLSVHDNFFELGGDSILSIQVVARAGQAGLRLTPKQVFQHQTVAELARAAGTTAEVQAEQGVVTGAVPLTPIQSWFFEREQDEPHHFNQALLLEPKKRLEPAVVAAAAAALETHHDALRLRFRKGPLGWRQELAEAGRAPFHHVDLSRVPADEQRTAIEAEAAALQRSLDLANGPIWRVALFDRGADAAQRLLIVVHHLAVDGVSWRILLEDLQAACDRLARGEAAALPRKTTSFKHWAESLQSFARADERSPELPYWRSVASAEFPRLSRSARAEPDENTCGSTGTVSVSLDAEQTRSLLQDPPKVYRARIQDVLLTSLARAFRRATGASVLRVDLEGHGREGELVGADLSRTVGWFTSVHPVRIALPDGQDPGTLLKSVKEQLRALPHEGIGYGILRYASPAGEELRALPESEVSFNYLGQLDGSLGAGGLVPAPESVGPVRSPNARRRHLLEINGLVVGGRLRVDWIYAERVHERAEVEGLARAFQQELQALVAHCQSPDAGGCTPSDFPLAGLDQASIDRLAGHGRDIEDVYPLSPLQEGMLFHSLLRPEENDYFSQLSFVLEGDLDASALSRAWQLVVDRHTILRTAFAWRDLPRPLQVVRRRAPLDVDERDWSGLSAADAAAALERLLEDDRRRGFDLAAPPLMRIGLTRLSPRTHRVVWSFHHAILDGWSFPIVLREVFQAYEAFRRGDEPHLPRPRPFGEYAAWLQAKDDTAEAPFWKRYLAGFTAPTRLAVERSRPLAGGEEAYGEERLELSADTTRKLHAFTRRHQITMNTLFAGAWALLLSRHGGERDVVFGATVSGRPAELPGVESMVGLFINCLPVRARVVADAPLLAWLRSLQEQQAELRQHEHTPLAAVQRWSDVPAGQPLFESILVFENLPVRGSVLPGGLQVSGGRFSTHTNVPLHLRVRGAQTLWLELTHDRRRFDDATAAALLSRCRTLVEAALASPEEHLCRLSLLSDDERRGPAVTPRPRTPYTEFPRGDVEQPIAGRFASVVTRGPDRCAVRSGRDWTYRELDRMSGAVARRLRAGAGPAQGTVSLLFDHGGEMAAAMLGALKAGCAYVPLDPSYPQERLAYMVDDAESSVVLTSAGNASLARTLAGRERAVIEWEELDPAGGEGFAHDVSPDAVAYVLYTSGSTGRPKGVAQSHRNVLHHIRCYTNALHIAADDRLSVLSSYSFDAAVMDVFGGLLSGATIAPFDVRSEGPARLAHWLRAERISIYHSTPTVFRHLAEALEAHEPLDAVRLVVLGGELARRRDLEAFRAHFRGGVFVNGFGPTESTLALQYFADRTTVVGGEGLPVGFPVEDTEVLLLDAAGERSDVYGEIAIRSRHVALGYWRNEALTQAAFLPDPDGGERRIYRTGDLGRVLPGGAIEVVGRRDDQVKVRGVRIEPGEIEAALCAHPDVRQAAVVAVEDGPRGARLVAYVVAADGRGPTQRSLRDFLRGRLPDAMVPASFVELDALPLTPTGKVDRGALPRPEAPTARGHEAPRTPIEEQLVEIWKAVLGVPEVGIHDGFFELGGHSLLATQVVSRVRDAMGVQLALRALFDAPTVAELALVVLGELAAGEDAGALAGILEEVQRAGESSPTADGADGGGERA